MKVAIIGITAGGVGLDFSSAQNVVFLELPRSSSDLLQVVSSSLAHNFLFKPIGSAKFTRRNFVISW